MIDLPELEAYLSLQSYLNVAKHFNISLSAAQSRVRRQTLTVLAVTNYLKHESDWQEKYNFIIWRIDEHLDLIRQLLTDYKNIGLPAQLPNKDNRLLSSLTVAEFQQLMKELLKRV